MFLLQAMIGVGMILGFVIICILALIPGILTALIDKSMERPAKIRKVVPNLIIILILVSILAWFIIAWQRGDTASN